MPPTPDDFSELDGVLYGEPKRLVDSGWKSQGTRAVPLLHTASEELEDALHQAGDSPGNADVRAGQTTESRRRASGHISSPTAARRLAEPWVLGSPDPLADLIATDDAGAAAKHPLVSGGDAVDELLRADAPLERAPVDAAEGSHGAAARSAARVRRADPLAGVLENMPAEGPEDALAARARRSDGTKLFGDPGLLNKAGTQQTVNADKEEIDAALRRFARKRAAPLDDELAVEGAENFPAGSSRPASPCQRRVRARPAASTASITSLRSLACGKAK